MAEGARGEVTKEKEAVELEELSKLAEDLKDLGGEGGEEDGKEKDGGEGEAAVADVKGQEEKVDAEGGGKGDQISEEEEETWWEERIEASGAAAAKAANAAAAAGAFDAAAEDLKREDPERKKQVADLMSRFRLDMKGVADRQLKGLADAMQATGANFSADVQKARAAAQISDEQSLAAYVQHRSEQLRKEGRSEQDIEVEMSRVRAAARRMMEAAPEGPAGMVKLGPAEEKLGEEDVEETLSGIGVAVREWTVELVEVEVDNVTLGEEGRRVELSVETHVRKKELGYYNDKQASSVMSHMAPMPWTLGDSKPFRLSEHLELSRGGSGWTIKKNKYIKGNLVSLTLTEDQYQCVCCMERPVPVGYVSCSVDKVKDLLQEKGRAMESGDSLVVNTEVVGKEGLLWRKVLPAKITFKMLENKLTRTPFEPFELHAESKEPSYAKASISDPKMWGPMEVPRALVQGKETERLQCVIREFKLKASWSPYRVQALQCADIMTHAVQVFKYSKMVALAQYKHALRIGPAVVHIMSVSDGDGLAAMIEARWDAARKAFVYAKTDLRKRDPETGAPTRSQAVLSDFQDCRGVIYVPGGKATGHLKTGVINLENAEGVSPALDLACIFGYSLLFTALVGNDAACASVAKMEDFGWTVRYTTYERTYHYAGGRGGGGLLSSVGGGVASGLADMAFDF